MLHASRDCLRNQKKDTLSIRWDVADGYYGEAFGIMRALQVLGYGDFGPCNIPDKDLDIWNLRWWFCQLENRVLAEEGFDGDHHCEHCMERYDNDDKRHHQL